MPKRKYGSSPVSTYRKRARTYSGPRRPYGMRKYVRIPARLRYSRRTFRRSAKVSRTMTTVAERKLKGLVELNESAPSPIQIGAQAYEFKLATGVAPPPTWSGFTPIQGFNFPTGTAPNERVGRYMYLDHTTVRMRIDMNSSQRLTQPIQFRMIVFKARRATTPTGFSYDPNDTLFLNEEGTQFGASQAGVTGNDLMMYPLNKRDWVILKEKRFTLQSVLQDQTPNTAAFQGKYPNFKNINLTLNHKIKAAFQLPGGNDQPTDYDYSFGIVIYAASIGRDNEGAGNFEVNLRGTTSALDS